VAVRGAGVSLAAQSSGEIKVAVRVEVRVEVTLAVGVIVTGAWRGGVPVAVGVLGNMAGNIGFEPARIGSVEDTVGKTVSPKSCSGFLTEQALITHANMRANNKAIAPGFTRETIKYPPQVCALSR
jgi:hypothetical protein